MNLPNKLTLLRIFMIPVFVAVYYITAIPYNFVISAAIFALASFTDFLDGHIARKHNLVTNFGKFLDPIADKILVSTALIIMLVAPDGIKILPPIAPVFVALILARELMISGFRLVASNRGLVISADITGKIKTFLTDISILYILICATFTQTEYDLTNKIGFILLIVCSAITVISGAECIIKNREVLKEQK